MRLHGFSLCARRYAPATKVGNPLLPSVERQPKAAARLESAALQRVDSTMAQAKLHSTTLAHRSTILPQHASPLRRHSNSSRSTAQPKQRLRLLDEKRFSNGRSFLSLSREERSAAILLHANYLSAANRHKAKRRFLLDHGLWHASWRTPSSGLWSGALEENQDRHTRLSDSGRSDERMMSDRN